MKKPKNADAQRCIKLRIRNKKGERTSEEEDKFCARMYRDYESWYRSINAEVFNASVPFGSTVRMTESGEIEESK